MSNVYGIDHFVLIGESHTGVKHAAGNWISKARKSLCGMSYVTDHLEWGVPDCENCSRKLDQMKARRLREDRS